MSYLGLLLDNQLSWQHHKDFVINKLCIALGVFYKLKYCVPQRVLVQVYYGIVNLYLP